MADSHAGNLGVNMNVNIHLNGEEQLNRVDSKVTKLEGEHKVELDVTQKGANKQLKQTNKNLEKVGETAKKANEALSTKPKSNYSHVAKNYDKINKAMAQINASNKTIGGRGGKSYLDYFTTEAQAIKNVTKAWSDYQKASSAKNLTSKVKNTLLRDVRVAQGLGVSFSKAFGDDTKKITGTATRIFKANEKGKSGMAGKWALDDVKSAFSGLRTLASLGYTAEQLTNATGIGMQNNRKLAPMDKKGFGDAIATIQKQAGVSKMMPTAQDYIEYKSAMEADTKAQEESAKASTQQAKEKKKSTTQTKKQTKTTSAASRTEATTQSTGGKQQTISGTVDADKIRRTPRSMRLTSTVSGKDVATNYTYNANTGRMERAGQIYSASYIPTMKKAAKIQADIQKTQNKIATEMGKVNPDHAQIQKWNAQLSTLQGNFSDCEKSAKAFMGELQASARRAGASPSKTMDNFYEDTNKATQRLLGGLKVSSEALAYQGAASELTDAIRRYGTASFSTSPHSQAILSNFAAKAASVPGPLTKSDKAIFEAQQKQIRNVLYNSLSGHIKTLNTATEKNGSAEMRANTQRVKKDVYSQIGNIVSNVATGQTVDLAKEMGTLSSRLTSATPVADRSNISSLNANIQKALANNSSMNMQYANQLKAISKVITNSNGNMTYGALSGLQGQYHEIMAQVGQAGQLGKGFWGSFTDRIKSGSAQFMARYFSLYQVIAWAKQAAAAINQVDLAMTELRKVSGASALEMDSAFRKSAETAKEIGATISDTISATADWSRLGYSLSDSEQLANIAILYKNIGDGIDIDTANTSLISTLQGFQMEASEAESIIDKFNEVLFDALLCRKEIRIGCG